jgi:hypothetical protein
LSEERYPGVAETVAAAGALAGDHPGLCGLRQVGSSRAGRPLLLLSVGHGSRNVLVVAGPHANEAAIGGSTVLRLAQQVVRDGRLRSDGDAAWHFLLCADPDGARLNEGWLRGPFTVAGHYRHFFRPAAAEQPEWLSPGVPLSDALPETRALLRLIDELRPVLQCSLHAIDVGGSFVELTGDLPGLADRLAKSAAEFHLPLELGIADALHWPSPGPGVYVMPKPGRPKFGESVLADTADSTWTYVERYGGVTAVVEVPMWACERVGDPAPHPDPDQALWAAGEGLRRDIPRLAGLLAGLPAEARAPGPGAGGPLLRAAEELIGFAPLLPRNWDPTVRRSAAPPLPPLTMARVTSIQVFAQRIPLRIAAMLRQLWPTPELEGLVGEWARAYETAYDARWVPVADQVEHQAATVIAAFESLRG